MGGNKFCAINWSQAQPAAEFHVSWVQIRNINKWDKQYDWFIASQYLPDYLSKTLFMLRVRSGIGHLHTSSDSQGRLFEFRYNFIQSTEIHEQLRAQHQF